MVELSVPVSDFEAFSKAYELGADSVFVCLKGFSLGTSSGSFTLKDIEQLEKLKPQGKRLYCAIDCFFHNPKISELDSALENYSFDCIDAFIISDIGILSTIRKHFPNVAVHLSSFANCLNNNSAEMFSKLGLNRIILGHEANKDDISKIANQRHDFEIEVQVYGTMCMSYSGRTLLSTHFENCKVPSSKLAIEEEQRKGLFFPIEEKNGFITVLSSKELNLLGELQTLISCGVNVFRIENPNSDSSYLENVIPLFKQRESLNNTQCTGFFNSNGPIDFQS